jgi:hypothetical protein
MFSWTGSWWVKSESDPRWDGSGSSRSVGGFVIPAEAKAHIDGKKRELGCEPPADCEYGYMKD